METFDNKNNRYLLPEFGTKVLETALTLEKGKGYNVINKVNCGNGGTEALLGLNMHKYPNVYLFLISHSKAGVEGKEKENNHKNVVFLHGNKENNFTIQEDKHHYMCTPEAIWKRWDNFKEIADKESNKVIFIFDEIHKGVMDRSYRVFRQLIGNKRAVSLGITATPHQSQHKRTVLTVTNLPKLNVIKDEEIVKQPSSHVIKSVIDTVKANNKNITSVIAAFPDTSPILKLLDWAHDERLKVYVEVGDLVGYTVSAIENKKVITDDVNEADFFIGTGPIADSISLFHNTAKKVRAFISIESDKPLSKEGNDFKRFKDADACQLPFRFRNATEFHLTKVEKEEKRKYSKATTNMIVAESRTKHFVNKKGRDLSGNVAYSFANRKLRHYGVETVVADTYLEEILVDEPPKNTTVIIDGEEYEKKPKYFFPYIFEKKEALPSFQNLPNKAYIDPSKFYREDLDSENYRGKLKHLCTHLSVDGLYDKPITTADVRKFLYYVNCKIFNNDFNTPIGIIEIDEFDRIKKVPNLVDLYDKLEKQSKKTRALKSRRFADLLGYIQKGLTVERFENSRLENKSIQASPLLANLKLLYQVHVKKLEGYEEWYPRIIDRSDHMDDFDIKDIDDKATEMMEDSKETVFSEMVLTRFFDYYDKKGVLLEETLTILCENEGYIRNFYQQSRRYGQLSRLSRLDREGILQTVYGFGKWACYDCKSASLASVCFFEYGIEVPTWGFYKGEGLEREKSKLQAMIFTNSYFWHDENNEWFIVRPKESSRDVVPAEKYLKEMSKHLPDFFIQKHLYASHEMLVKCDELKIEPISFFCRHTYHEKKIITEFEDRLRLRNIQTNSVHDEIYMFGDKLPRKGDELFYLEFKDKKAYNPFNLRVKELTTMRDELNCKFSR